MITLIKGKLQVLLKKGVYEITLKTFNKEKYLVKLTEDTWSNDLEEYLAKQYIGYTYGDKYKVKHLNYVKDFKELE